jgi:putative hydrolase of the HAD superfamily
MAIRAVFFDLDDTLLDTSGSQLGRAERIVERLLLELPDLDSASFIQRVLTRDPSTGWSVGVSSLLQELGVHETELGRELLGLWFFEGCYDLACCLPGAEEVVRDLNQTYILGVITNGREGRQRPKFEALGIHEYFRVFLSSERAGVEKPAPGIFRLALDEAGVEPAEAVFVGDRLDVNVLGAIDAGMHAVWLDHRGRWPSGRRSRTSRFDSKLG